MLIQTDEFGCSLPEFPRRMIPENDFDEIAVGLQFVDCGYVIAVSGDKYKYIFAWFAVFVGIFCKERGNSGIDFLLFIFNVSIFEMKFETRLFGEGPYAIVGWRTRAKKCSSANGAFVSPAQKLMEFAEADRVAVIENAAIHGLVNVVSEPVDHSTDSTPFDVEIRIVDVHVICHVLPLSANVRIQRAAKSVAF